MWRRRRSIRALLAAALLAFAHALLSAGSPWPAAGAATGARGPGLLPGGRERSPLQALHGYHDGSGTLGSSAVHQAAAMAHGEGDLATRGPGRTAARARGRNGDDHFSPSLHPLRLAGA